MDKNELLKEIITTETEKFTEEGIIKERVKETREKFYSIVTEEELEQAKTINQNAIVFAEEPKKEESIQKPESQKTQEELIKEVGQKLDSKPMEAQANATPSQSQPPQGYKPIVPQYNVVGGSVPAAPTDFKFAWER